MIDMHFNFIDNNMHKNVMFYTLILINNYIITNINCILSWTNHTINNEGKKLFFANFFIVFLG